MSVAEYRTFNGRVYSDGTVHTLEGWERRKLRDKARQRAKVAVMRRHRSEFERIVASDPDRQPNRRFQRALRELAAAHPATYQRAYAAALVDLGYESHPCSSLSTTATLTPESSAPGAASTAPVPVNPWLEESTMDDDTSARSQREAEAV